MSGTFEGKVALVTGGSRGIGRSIAGRLALEGAEVVLTSRSLAAAAAAAAEIQAAGGRARGVEMNVRDDAAVEAGVKELLEGCGTIPILVNNAGITRDCLLLRMKKEDWDLVLETNLSGVYRLCRAVVPSMVRQPPIASKFSRAKPSGSITP